MLYITHDLATARHFSSSIMVMYRGEVVESGTSDDVILSPAHPYTRLLASAAPDPEAEPEQLPGAPAERAATANGTGCRFRNRCPDAMDICTRQPPPLQIRAGHWARCWLHGDSPGGGPDKPGDPPKTDPHPAA